MPIMCLAFDNHKIGPTLPSNENSDDHPPQHKLLEMSTHSLSSSSDCSSGTGSGDGNDGDHDDVPQQSALTLVQECPSFASSEEDSTGGPPARKPKKGVHFSDAEPEIIGFVRPSSKMTQEERSQVHWQLQDYEYFRGTARIIASEILKLSTTKKCPTAHSYDTVLTRVHQYCSQHCDWKTQGPQDVDACHESLVLHDDHIDEPPSWGASFPKEEGEGQPQLHETISSPPLTRAPTHSTPNAHAVNTVPVPVPPNLFAALTHWIRAGHSRRGLEKFCIPHHMQTRPLERQAGVDAVLIAQDLLQKTRNESASSTKDGMFHFGKWSFSLALPDEEILRILSERFSATSRKFATTMGHADAAAVGNYTMIDTE